MNECRKGKRKVVPQSGSSVSEVITYGLYDRKPKLTIRKCLCEWQYKLLRCPL